MPASVDSIQQGRPSSRSGDQRPPTLDVLTLSRKEGWRAVVDAEPQRQPELLERQELSALSTRARAEYDRRRRIWHANLPIIRTTQLEEVQEALWDVVDSNQQFADRIKTAVGLEGPAAIGKTIAVQDFAASFHRREIAELGEFTHAGHERWPVCRVGMTGNTGLREFNRAMLRFYNHAGTKRGTAAEFADRALDCVLSCETKLLIVDDLHFLKVRTTQTELSNQFKYISNEFPLTIVFVGIGLRGRGLYSDGPYAEQILGQTGRRTVALAMRGFTVADDSGKRDWRRLLLTLEKRIVLADKYRGMLAEDLSDYLWARTSGCIGSLTQFLARSCNKAVRTGTEVLNQHLLDTIRADEAAEQRRLELEHQIAVGAITTRLGHRSPRPPATRRAIVSP